MTATICCHTDRIPAGRWWPAALGRSHVEGLEPRTVCLEGRCSILLSYGTKPEPLPSGAKMAREPHTGQASAPSGHEKRQAGFASTLFDMWRRVDHWRQTHFGPHRRNYDILLPFLLGLLFLLAGAQQRLYLDEQHPAALSSGRLHVYAGFGHNGLQLHIYNTAPAAAYACSGECPCQRTWRPWRRCWRKRRCCASTQLCPCCKWTSLASFERE